MSSAPSGASSDAVRSAHCARTDGSSAHRNVQSQIKSYVPASSVGSKKSAHTTSTRAAIAASGAAATSARAASHAVGARSHATMRSKPCAASASASYARPHPGTSAVHCGLLA